MFEAGRDNRFLISQLILLREEQMAGMALGSYTSFLSNMSSSFFLRLEKASAAHLLIEKERFHSFAKSSILSKYS